MILNVIIENAGPNWCAAPLSDEVGPVLVTAATRDETIAKFGRVLAEHLNDLRSDGIETPAIEAIEFHETVPFAEALAA
jgi:hypothetical protein